MKNHLSKLHSVWSLCFFLVLCLIIELLGGLATSQSVNTWYPTLIQPEWSPPTWVFGPTWTLLYGMIAVAGWLVYIQPSSTERTMALILYAVQLGLNLAWSFIFFGLQSPLLGLIEICVLWLAIIATIIWFFKVSKLAAILFIPYALWTSYTVALNASLYILNR